MATDVKQYPVSLQEIQQARLCLSQYLKPTQLIRYQGLSKLLEADVYVKHENHNPTGSFKIRGGVNLMSHLKSDGIKGVVTFSTGNHGISIATAAAWFGLNAVVVVPENNNPSKNRLIRETGARLIEAGRSFEEASRRVEVLCREEELYYAHPANEPHLINGVGTEFLEIQESLPDLDAIFLPIGAGSEVAAAVTALKPTNPGVEIFAVQAETSPAAYLSWRDGEIKAAANETFAGGFATGTAYELPFGIYRDQLADFVLLSEEELYQGIALAGFYTHNLVEGAGASTIMAALKVKNRLKGKKIVLQFSGCNAAPEEISRAYKLPQFSAGLIE